MEPFSDHYGWDRGTPVDRFYIDAFLAEHAGEIKGRVLEIGDAEYTKRHGGDRVTQSDVLHASPGNPQATIIADHYELTHFFAHVPTAPDWVNARRADLPVYQQLLEEVRAAGTPVIR